MLVLGTMRKEEVLVTRNSTQGIDVPVGWPDKRRLLTCVIGVCYASAGTDARVMATCSSSAGICYPRVNTGGISKM